MNEPWRTSEALNPLESAYATWEAHRDELLQTAAGKWVLIHQDQIGGIYHCQQDACDQGYRQYGLVPFLVHKITDSDEPVEILSPWILSKHS